eukprot:IDg4979t1
MPRVPPGISQITIRVGIFRRAALLSSKKFLTAHQDRTTRSEIARCECFLLANALTTNFSASNSRFPEGITRTSAFCWQPFCGAVLRFAFLWGLLIRVDLGRVWWKNKRAPVKRERCSREMIWVLVARCAPAKCSSLALACQSSQKSWRAIIGAKPHDPLPGIVVARFRIAWFVGWELPMHLESYKDRQRHP